MDTRAAFTTDEKWLLIRIMDYLSPKADPECGTRCELGVKERGTGPRLYKAYRYAQEYDRLATMDARNRWISRRAAGPEPHAVRRSNWTEARQFLVLYTKLLDAFGWGSAELTAAVHGATRAVGTEEAKNAVLFQAILSLCRSASCAALPATSDQHHRGPRPALYRHAGGEGRDQEPDGAPRARRRHAPVGALAARRAARHGEDRRRRSGCHRPRAALLLRRPWAATATRSFCGAAITAGVSSTPGFFARTLMSAGCLNPVVLLDELDKAGGYAHGDLSDTLTEVFDVNQAHHFGTSS